MGARPVARPAADTLAAQPVPVRYGVSGNQQVARALGLEPIDQNAAVKALAEGEPTP